MKVCVAAPHANFMVHGGASTQLRKTAQFLPANGVEVEFFDPWKNYSQGAIDFFHIFGANLTTFDLAMRLHDLGINYVVSTIFFTMHNPWFLRFTREVEKLSKMMFKGIFTDYGILHNICALSGGVLPNTGEEARLVERGLGIDAAKIRTIPNGVEERFLDTDSGLFIKKYGFKDFILYVGTIGSYRKNTLSLIRALKKIDCPAVFIGKVFRNAYGRQCLEEAAQNKNITIIEGLPNDSHLLESAYAACDTFVLPSFFETPGIAALEAGLAGAKIAITGAGGTREYFKDMAVYVKPKSVSSIKAGIEHSLNRTNSTELQQHIRQNFLWPQVAAKTAAAYQELLNS